MSDSVELKNNDVVRVGISKSTKDHHWFQLADSQYINFVCSPWVKINDKTYHCLLSVLCGNVSIPFTCWFMKQDFQSGQKNDDLHMSIHFKGTLPIQGARMTHICMSNHSIVSGIHSVTISLSVVIHES